MRLGKRLVFDLTLFAVVFVSSARPAKSLFALSRSTALSSLPCSVAAFHCANAGNPIRRRVASLISVINIQPANNFLSGRNQKHAGATFIVDDVGTATMANTCGAHSFCYCYEY